MAKEKARRVKCILCKKGVLTEAENKRRDICFKCIPEDESVMWVKQFEDKDKEKMRTVVRTKKVVRQEITDSMFPGNPPIVRIVKRYNKYTSK